MIGLSKDCPQTGVFKLMPKDISLIPLYGCADAWRFTENGKKLKYFLKNFATNHTNKHEQEYLAKMLFLRNAKRRTMEKKEI